MPAFAAPRAAHRTSRSTSLSRRDKNGDKHATIYTAGFKGTRRTIFLTDREQCMIDVEVRRAGDNLDLHWSRQFFFTDAFSGRWISTIPGWERIANGWTTAGPDVSGQGKAGFNETMNKLVGGAIHPPEPFIIVVMPTSTLGPISVEVFVQNAFARTWCRVGEVAVGDLDVDAAHG